MIKEFLDDYLPEEIIHRDEQINQIKEVFHNFKTFKSGTNLVLLGVTGSGKSTIIKKITQEEDGAIYINIAQTKTPYNTIKSIFNLNIKTHSCLLEETIKQLQKRPKILIFDEVDKIKGMKEFFNDLNTIYRTTMIPIILITLKQNIIEEMPIDVKNTLFFERILLPSYNALELRDILISRLKNMDDNIKNALTEETIGFISALSAKQGSARLLINLTLRCIQKNNFSIEFIAQVYDTLMKEDWMSFVYGLNETEKEFLKYLLETDCDFEKEISSEVIQEKMGLSAGRISQIITNLEKYPVIKSRHNNLGRGGGRRRLIKFASKEMFDYLLDLIYGVRNDEK